MHHEAANQGDIYARITNIIVHAIEEGAGAFRMPWHGEGGRLALPVNAQTGKPYRGINTLALWVRAHEKSHGSHLWGTYSQWGELGAQVKKGEKSAPIVVWKIRERGGEAGDAGGAEENHRRLFARAYAVFNLDQVEGYAPEIPPALEDSERIESAESYFRSLGVAVENAGDSAHYDRAADRVRMPKFSRFRDALGYYAVLAHEATHWTGAESRLGRDLSGRFGSASYAVEELVAELGAAFLCGSLGIAPTPRPDHAAYVAMWLRVLKSDKRAIFAAASKAQEAVDWMHEKAAAKALAA